MSLLVPSCAPLRRGVATITAITVLLSITNCVAYRWKPIAVTNLSLPHEKIARRVIRLKSATGTVEMEMAALDFPYVSGSAMSGNGLVGFNLDSATKIELLTPEAPRSKRVTPMTRESVRRNPELVKGRQVRFETGKGDVVLRDVTKLEDPWITGRLADGDGPIRVDLAQIDAVEIRELNGSKTTLKTVGLAAGIVAAVAIIVAATKSSCPFVYIDRGSDWELVGEAYAGAAFRSTQRDDLLPLPDVGNARTVQIRLRNEARETQYTDRAELVIVDHAPHLRALSTFDQRAVLVGEARSPERAQERRGRDVTNQVYDRDEHLWVTDPDAAVAVDDAMLEDQVIAEFSAPARGTPVLELVAGNTAWLDLVFGRFFAAMGDRLPTYLVQGNDPAAGQRIQRWREREGVDLVVELWSGTSWERIALVPTVGAAALREIAIPIPQERKGEGALKFRLRGGLGFWRIDRLALSVQDDSQPALNRVTATRAHASGGIDRLATISTTDEQYDALSEMNESLEMSFDLPERAAHLSRTAFLFTRGYYNVHLPVQARWQPGMLKVIRDEPGGLSRFSRDLAREYAHRQTAMARAR